MIRFACPSWNKDLRANDTDAGKRTRCPNCKSVIPVPASIPATPIAAKHVSPSKTILGETEPAIKYNCPRCKKPLESPYIEAGTKKPCPACGGRLQVPAPTPAVAPTAILAPPLPIPIPIPSAPRAPISPPEPRTPKVASMPSNGMLVKIGAAIAAAVFIGGGIFTLSVSVDKLPPLETMPTLTIPSYIMAGIGASFLVIVLWRVVTLRVFRAFFSLIAAVLVAYYPVAYTCHYWWFKYYEPALEGRQLEPWEDFVKQNWTILDYGVMAVCVFVGLLVLSFTMGNRFFAEDTRPIGASSGMPAQYIPDKASAGLAVVLSFFYPGLGQMYNGQIAKGIFIMLWPLIFTVGICCGFPALLSALTQQAQQAHQEAGGQGQVTVVPLVSPFVLLIAAIVLNVVFYVWTLYDAYQGAEYINETNRRRYGGY